MFAVIFTPKELPPFWLGVRVGVSTNDGKELTFSLRDDEDKEKHSFFIGGPQHGPSEQDQAKFLEMLLSEAEVPKTALG